jgi:DNA photolyase
MPSSAANAAPADCEGMHLALLQVWFKHDLRLDDHPGLVAALEREKQHSSGGVILAFVFDPAYYPHLLATPSGVEGRPCVRCGWHGCVDVCCVLAKPAGVCACAAS